MTDDSFEEEFNDHRENYDGFCTECHDWTREGRTEPDAEGYECPECEGMTCVGADNALIMGLLE